MQPKKEPCPFGCGKMLHPKGKFVHFKATHPGESTPGAAASNPAGIHPVQKGTVVFLNEALDSLKARREVLARRLAEVTDLQNEDRALAKEQEAVESVLGKITGRALHAGAAAGD